MKKLQKLVLNKAVKMTDNQMKHITGGYDGIYGGPSCSCGGEWIMGCTTIFCKEHCNTQCHVECSCRYL